ncbi:protein ZAR1-like isoform X1 [Canis lupus baileyi]|uniref:ZAR1-like protein isoform X1 n=1 Tax=Canis lupus dingo TaxID=286419 RepID=UPI0018F6BA1E|nr:ZAR1-like protein isoform X1 [Canis lupus dingo]XP_038290842.1 ZAR1-like protein isoform X1 [Canis lupus familiaris]XP_038290843.1 ZAR1-like protein isoform X1 [Canis lupus familiaris]XP_038429257.1 ZAR1-like protein isoform X1 [Canis lupus familiaris]XP_038429258.1 ZAR1-like protein isoform X1 [Canis lupus familiaris]
MERLVRVPYGLYQGYGNTVPLGHPGLSEHEQPDWRRNTGPPNFLARPGLLVPANASHYCMDPYKRAQLKAILSQMNPSLSLQLYRANTREVGVQVSPRVDKSVQCSLGPRTLCSRSPWGSAGHKAPLTAWGVYSPVMGHRSLIQLQREGEDQERKALLHPTEASEQQQQQPPPMPRSEEDKQEEPHQHNELEEEDASSPRKEKSKQAQGVGGADLLRKPTFQFLEAKYGYFHCKDCKTRWESAYVWCISGTNKVYFKQLCCKCQKSFNPYRVEAIQCQDSKEDEDMRNNGGGEKYFDLRIPFKALTGLFSVQTVPCFLKTCSKSCCSCPQKKRHIDLRRPHRQDLCGRCKDKRFSCGNTYSFKYIM